MRAAARRQVADGKSKGRSERLLTGPCPLHQECPAITCRELPQQTTSVLALYNGEVTTSKVSRYLSVMFSSS